MEIGAYRTETASQTDANRLADLRVAAMRPSLEAAGRFDPARARERFLKSFDPQDTKVVYLDEMIVGFYVVRAHSDHLYLDHLYVAPGFQGHGVGRGVIGIVKNDARARGVPIRLMALNGSPANAFYQKCGFSFVCVDALDTVYEWRPS